MWCCMFFYLSKVDIDVYACHIFCSDSCICEPSVSHDHLNSVVSSCNLQNEEGWSDEDDKKEVTKQSQPKAK